MEGTDIIMCNFLFSGVGASGDKFICTDRTADANAYQIPDIDATNNVEYISTDKSYDTVNKLATLAVTFRRKLNTGDGTDYLMSDGKTIDAIWAWGRVMSSAIQGHGANDWNRGSFRLKMNGLLSTASLLGHSFTAVMSLAIGVLALSMGVMF